MAQRVKGSEVVLTVVGPDGTEEGLGDIQSAEIEYQLDILSEGFLGEGSERKDDIFRGVRGRLEAQLSQQEALQFADKVVARAQRRTPASAVFNLVCTLNMPNGQRPRIQLQDIKFGAVPFTVGGRDEYVRFTVEFACSQVRVLYT